MYGGSAGHSRISHISDPELVKQEEDRNKYLPLFYPRDACRLRSCERKDRRSATYMTTQERSRLYRVD